ncbi:spore germination protein YaaH [Peptoniphilus olsenii]|uniref:Spore germination protein YaaH n=1 Tax=Peptoniphilus olsenii TaxID=411570 RepID=A0ABV2J6M0_9FIRM
MKKFFMGVFVLIALAALAFLFVENRGSKKVSTIYDGFAFLSEDEYVDKEDFDMIDGMIYLSLDYINKNIDKNIEFDKSKGEIIIDNEKAHKVLTLNSKEAQFNDGTVELRAPAIEKDGKILLPIESFIYDYKVRLRYNRDIQLLLLDREDIKYKKSTTKEGAVLLEDNSKRSPIIKRLKKDEPIYIYDESGKYYKVRMIEGYAGYIEKDFVNENFEEEILDSHESSQTSKPLNITWDYTYAEHSQEKVEKIQDINGLDIIIPTWFSIKNGNGDMIDRGNFDYIDRYNNLGIEVWGYLDNSFDPEITHEALSNESTRTKIVNKTLELCNKYNMKGLNIDFEHTNIDDRDFITEFVKELKEKVGNDLIISVDVTPQISSDVTKEPYDRKKLSNIADYIIVMAYDQHWSSSEEAGSVAQYKWVEGSINVLFRTIPNEKMILGVPTYSRLWKESNGKVTSKTISMSETLKLISDKNLKPVWDEESSQNYVEYSENGAVYKIWIEDAASIEKKVSLVNKYNLSGVASWRLGFETKDIWDVIEKEIQNNKNN